MGMDIGTYHARISSFIVKCKEKHTMGSYTTGMAGKQIWLSGLVTMMQLLIGGVELNMGVPEGQKKTDKILTYVRNQEECKVIKRVPQSKNC
jgi:hypothetical protein